MPAAATGFRSRTSRWQTSAFTSHGSHRVGASGPTRRAVSQRARRSRRAKEVMPPEHRSGSGTAPRRGPTGPARPPRWETGGMDLDPAVAARLRRNDAGLVPAIVQQHDTGEVLMLGWMDDEALARTLATGRATYWSRSRGEYWVKGETSGHRQWVQGGPPRLRRRHRCCSRSTRRARRATPATRTCFDADLARAAGAEPTRRMTDGRRLFGPGRPGRPRSAPASRRCPEASPGPPPTAGPAPTLVDHSGGHVPARRRPRPRRPGVLGRPPRHPRPGTTGGRRPGRAGRRGARRHRRPRAVGGARLRPRGDRRPRHARDLAHTSPAGGGWPSSAPSWRWRPPWSPYVSARPGPRWAAGTTRPRPAPPGRGPRRARPVARHRPGPRPDGPGRPLGCGYPDPTGPIHGPIREEHCMSDNHGNTPAAWAAVAVAMLGFVVAGIGLMFDPVEHVGVLGGRRPRRRVGRGLRGDGPDGAQRPEPLSR